NLSPHLGDSKWQCSIGTTTEIKSSPASERSASSHRTPSKGYMALGGAGAKTGHLDAKTRELIALAVAIPLRCDGCITLPPRRRRSSAPRRRRSPKPWALASASTPRPALLNRDGVDRNLKRSDSRSSALNVRRSSKTDWALLDYSLSLFAQSQCTTGQAAEFG